MKLNETKITVFLSATDWISLNNFCFTCHYLCTLWSVLCLILMRKKQNSLKLLTYLLSLLFSLLINCGSKILHFASFPSHSISLKLWVTMLSTWPALWVLERSLGVLKFVFFDYGVWLRSWNPIKLTQLKWCLLMKRYIHALFRVFSFVNHQINFDILVFIIS